MFRSITDQQTLAFHFLITIEAKLSGNARQYCSDFPSPYVLHYILEVHFPSINRAILGNYPNGRTCTFLAKQRDEFGCGMR